LLVEKIEGAWDTVVGLPVRSTVGLIEKVLFDQDGADGGEDDDDGEVEEEEEE